LKISIKYPFIFALIISNSAVFAEWQFKADNAGYYTDDVALFSATRRLSLKDDPTQPNIDKGVPILTGRKRTLRNFIRM
jgi:hypothetical protein